MQEDLIAIDCPVTTGLVPQPGFARRYNVNVVPTQRLSAPERAV